MIKQLFERLRIIGETEQGQQFKLLVPLDSEEAKRLHVRVDDPSKYPVGTILYFLGEDYDDDGFWWLDFVTDKALLGATSISSGQPGVIRFTPLRYKDILNVVAPASASEAKEEISNKQLGQVLTNALDKLTNKDVYLHNKYPKMRCYLDKKGNKLYTSSEELSNKYKSMDYQKVF